MDDTDYQRQAEPNKQEKYQAWTVAIGLQQVDGLVPSDYLVQTAHANIEGQITIDEAKQRINTYYENSRARSDDGTRTEEADKVSARIAGILSEKTFSFSPTEYVAIHRKLFDGIYDFAGQIRDYNITKAEWVLSGNTVLYASSDQILETLEYDLERERGFDYQGLADNQVVKHLARFTSDLWQIHAFGEGNTRTTAVFVIKYLRTLGYNISNDLFEQNSWYFRNALVRANYDDIKNNIYATPEYLYKFFDNLLLGRKHALKNRELRVYDTVNDTVNDTVFSCIKADGSLTAQEIATQLGKSLATIKRELKRLKDIGAITREGSDKTGKWIVR